MYPEEMALGEAGGATKGSQAAADIFEAKGVFHAETDHAGPSRCVAGLFHALFLVSSSSF
jgi:hypothetical protein